MSKRKHREEVEINFVALMDTMTNVVGVLLIVLVMVGISIANTVKKVMSDLPPVEIAEFERLQKQVASEAPAKTPEELQKELAETRERRKQHAEELKNLDTTMESQKVVITQMDELTKQLEERKKERDAKKAAADALLAGVEKSKALLDNTPAPVTPDALVVKLPNPRPYPKDPNETRVLVSREGAVFYNEKTNLDPVHDALKKAAVNLRYKEVNPAPFADLMDKVMGGKTQAQQAWPVVAEFVGKFQAEDVARTFRSLTEAQIKADKKQVERTGDLAAAMGKPMPDVAAAIADAVKGNFAAWGKLDPSADPAKPTIAVADEGARVKLTWYDQVKEVRKNPRETLAYFNDLAEANGVRDRAKDRVVYDAVKIVETVNRAQTAGAAPKAFTIKPVIVPGSTLVRLDITPGAGAGEPAAQFTNPNGGFQRRLRDIRAGRNGVAVFQVMADAFTTYLEGRKVADQLGVAATWDMIGNTDLSTNLNGYEVQRLAPLPPPGPPPPPAPLIQIKPPEKGLD